jgi:hypothetical protein
LGQNLFWATTTASTTITTTTITTMTITTITTTTTLMTSTTDGVPFELVCDALKPNLERGLKKAKLFTLAGCALLDDPNLCGEY